MLNKEQRNGVIDIVGVQLKSLLSDDNDITNEKPSDPIVQSVDINPTPTSYAGAVGASIIGQYKFNFNFRTLVVETIFDGLNISIPRKVVENSSFARCLIEVNSEADLMEVVTIGIPSLTGEDFTKESIHVEYEWKPPRCDTCMIFGHVQDQCPKRVKKMKSKPKCNNVVQFTGPSVKHHFRYEPKVAPSAPKNGATFVGDTSPKLKAIGISSKEGNVSTSNSYYALENDDEEKEGHIEIVYDESTNLFPHSKAGESSSFTAATG
nr:hypothetical protein [Tanacetum cinerariifolium]